MHLMKVWATYHTVLNDAESGARSNLVAADGSGPEVGGDNIGSVFPPNLLLCCCNTLLRAGYVLCVFTSRSMHNHTLTHLRVNGTFFCVFSFLSLIHRLRLPRFTSSPVLNGFKYGYDITICSLKTSLGPRLSQCSGQL